MGKTNSIEDSIQNHPDILHNRIKDLEKILEISCELSSSLRLGPLLKKIVKTASEITECEGASILLIDENIKKLKFTATTVLKSEVLSDKSVPLEGSIAGKIYNTSKPVVVYDVQSDPRFYKEIDRLLAFKTVSLIGVPLKIKTKTIGVLETVNKKDSGKFIQSDVDTLTALASHAAIAIENARLYENILKHADSLEERNQELTAYDHTVAHDLKNPLSVILGYSKILERDYKSMSESEICDKLDGITELGQKMLSIIDELLFLSGIREKEVELNPLDMGKIINSALTSLGTLIEQYKADIVYPESWPIAMGYAPWIEEVWVNYISNAIKYGGEPPCVELGAKEDKRGKIQFWVRDNGQGIDPDKQDILFRSYEKTNRNIDKGHGLGLTIIRRIVEKLGGEVGVSSTPGKGSIFTFKLPSYKSKL